MNFITWATLSFLYRYCCGVFPFRSHWDEGSPPCITNTQPEPHYEPTCWLRHAVT